MVDGHVIAALLSDVQKRSLFEMPPKPKYLSHLADLNLDDSQSYTHVKIARMLAPYFPDSKQRSIVMALARAGEPFGMKKRGPEYTGEQWRRLSEQIEADAEITPITVVENLPETESGMLVDQSAPDQPMTRNVKTELVANQIAELVIAQVRDLRQAEQPNTRNRFLQKWEGIAIGLLLFLGLIMVNTIIQRQMDPVLRSKVYAETQNWAKLREMYRNPPEGIGRRHVAALLKGAPLIEVDQQSVSEIDFKEETVTFTDGTVIGVGDHSSVTRRKGFKLKGNTDIVRSIGHVLNLPYIQFSEGGAVPFPRMWTEADLPWLPGERGNIYRYPR